MRSRQWALTEPEGDLVTIRRSVCAGAPVLASVIQSCYILKRSLKPPGIVGRHMHVLHLRKILTIRFCQNHYTAPSDSKNFRQPMANQHGFTSVLGS